MFDNQLEDRLRENAEAIFGQGKEPPAGHRERFELRLKSRHKTAARKKWLMITVSAAAVLAGFIFLLNPFSEERQSAELADVRNYYSMRLEEEAEITRNLIQAVDETHRKILLDNVHFIENEPIPDVQISDDEYIVLIASIYTNKIETLNNIQNIIRETTLLYN